MSKLIIFRHKDASAQVILKRKDGTEQELGDGWIELERRDSFSVYGGMEPDYSVSIRYDGADINGDINLEIQPQ